MHSAKRTGRVSFPPPHPCSTPCTPFHSHCFSLSLPLSLSLAKRMVAPFAAEVWPTAVRGERAPYPSLTLGHRGTAAAPQAEATGERWRRGETAPVTLIATHLSAFHSAPPKARVRERDLDDNEEKRDTTAAYDVSRADISPYSETQGTSRLPLLGHTGCFL